MKEFERMNEMIKNVFNHGRTRTACANAWPVVVGVAERKRGVSVLISGFGFIK